MSRLPASDIVELVERMNAVLRDADVEADNPVMRLITVALPVIPSVKITDTEKQQFLELFLDDFLPGRPSKNESFDVLT